MEDPESNLTLWSGAIFGRYWADTGLAPNSSNGSNYSINPPRLVYVPIAGSTRAFHCNLSLFTLALEPLTILLRGSQQVVGIRIGSLEETVSLYAGYTLLYLYDVDSSLRATLVVFVEFKCFFGGPN